MIEWIRSFILLGGLLTLVGGCCSNNPSNNTTTCSVTFNNSPGPEPTCSSTTGNVGGFVVITTPIAQGANIVVQWSTDSFATTTYFGTGVVNSQGMIAVPFGFTVNFCGTMTLQLRAFQDPNFTGVWIAGEGEGRYDGTQSGNGTFSTVTLTSSTSSVSNIEIDLDGTASQ